jgi:hypothetical protein
MPIGNGLATQQYSEITSNKKNRIFQCRNPTISPIHINKPVSTRNKSKRLTHYSPKPTSHNKNCMRNTSLHERIISYSNNLIGMKQEK